jgi:hypothetical protein
MTKLRPIASLSGFRVAVEAPPARGISFPVASSYQMQLKLKIISRCIATSFVT